jgi:hypothetical protein
MSLISPCPFCGSGHVIQVGGGRRFQHYRCATCAEVWTAQGPPERLRADDGPVRERLREHEGRRRKAS